MKRTYKQADLPRGHKGFAIHEITKDGEGQDVVGPEVLHMMASTMPGTVHDTVVALQQAYQRGRDDREAEIQADVLKATEEFKADLWKPVSFLDEDMPGYEAG